MGVVGGSASAVRRSCSACHRARRASAEEDERAERERLLALVREQGYVDGYTGVRASSTGQRFRVRDALVWNVQNEDGERLGQAAMFRRAEVEFL